MFQKILSFWDAIMVSVFNKPWELSISRNEKVIATLTSQETKDWRNVEKMTADLMNTLLPEATRHLLGGGEIHLVFVNKNNVIEKEPIKMRAWRT